MALSSPSPEAAALLNAICAVSAFHRAGRVSALPYKTNALQLLSSSLSTTKGCPEPMALEAQMASSMMLCVYNVRLSLLLDLTYSLLTLSKSCRSVSYVSNPGSVRGKVHSSGFF